MIIRVPDRTGDTQRVLPLLDAKAALREYAQQNWLMDIGGRVVPRGDSASAAIDALQDGTEVKLHKPIAGG